MGRFSNKVAIITGASGGLGPVLARKMVAEGANVVVTARRYEILQELERELGSNCFAVAADLTKEKDVEELVAATIAKFGQVDVMINNAAAPGQDKYIWEQTLENWNFTIDIDVTAAMLCTREVLRQSMLERKTGAILNLSSMAGWQAMPRKSHYCTAKSALRALTKVTALEAGPYGIRCNCLVPGGIDTELYQNWLRRLAGEEGITYEQKRAQQLAGVPLRTISTPEDVAEMALFLTSDLARTITGQSINVDSGAVMLG